MTILESVLDEFLKSCESRVIVDPRYYEVVKRWLKKTEFMSGFKIKPSQWNTSILKTRFEKEVALLNLKEFCEARGFILRKGKQFYFACKQLNFNF